MPSTSPSARCARRGRGGNARRASGALPRRRAWLSGADGGSFRRRRRVWYGGSIDPGIAFVSPHHGRRADRADPGGIDTLVGPSMGALLLGVLLSEATRISLGTNGFTLSFTARARALHPVPAERRVADPRRFCTPLARFAAGPFVNRRCSGTARGMHRLRRSPSSRPRRPDGAPGRGRHAAAGVDGAGKTTTMRAITALSSPPRAGSWSAGPTSRRCLRIAAWRKASLSPEGRQVFPNMSVEETCPRFDRSRVRPQRAQSLDRVYT